MALTETAGESAGTRWRGIGPRARPSRTTGPAMTLVRPAQRPPAAWRCSTSGGDRSATDTFGCRAPARSGCPPRWPADCWPGRQAAWPWNCCALDTTGNVGQSIRIGLAHYLHGLYLWVRYFIQNVCVIKQKLSSKFIFIFFNSKTIIRNLKWYPNHWSLIILIFFPNTVKPP